MNLKACNHFRLYNGKAAEAELMTLAERNINVSDHDILAHNLVVFRGGQNALQVLPQLVEYVSHCLHNACMLALTFVCPQFLARSTAEPGGVLPAQR